MFDHHMDMTTQVTKMCQAAWFQLRNIRSVRSSFTKEATLRLVCSLVMPRLDYGNISPYQSINQSKTSIAPISSADRAQRRTNL